jgi:hypothetical protein
LYRGESEENDANGQWWTSDPAKAAKYGAVTQRTLPAEIIGANAAQGAGARADEFVFPNKTPNELLLEQWTEYSLPMK